MKLTESRSVWCHVSVGWRLGGVVGGAGGVNTGSHGSLRTHSDSHLSDKWRTRQLTTGQPLVLIHTDTAFVAANRSSTRAEHAAPIAPTQTTQQKGHWFDFIENKWKLFGSLFCQFYWSDNTGQVCVCLCECVDNSGVTGCLIVEWEQ